MGQFSYLSEKIANAEFDYKPFKHLYLEDFLSEEHFNLVINNPQVHFPETNSTEELLGKLFDLGYQIQKFPGCSTDPQDYLRRLRDDDWPNEVKGNPIESYGMTFRLAKYHSDFLRELVEYLNGSEFKKTLEEKFEIRRPTNIITAVQKNLTKYEISPHPDVREKALTYLININKDSSIDDEDVHTHLLNFKEEWSFIPEYWRTHLEKNRCWVPWAWCDTKKITNKNNSMVMFAPDLETLHAIKLDYDHNKYQRTQLYGNLMNVGSIVPQMNWKELAAIKEKLSNEV